MQFEFDPEKSASNKAKHGLDFIGAQMLWKDDRLIEARAIDRNEPRRMAIGQIAGKLWTAIYTMRNEAVRLISVRRSRPEEVERYENDDIG
jgi:uncharacterized protein